MYKEFNRFTHVNDTPAVKNSGILQFSEIRPQSLCNIIIPWSIKYMWFNAAHNLLILTTPNCSLIRGHFPVWCGVRCTAPGGVGLRTMSGRLRAASGRCPDGSGRLRAASGRLRAVPDGSGRLRTAFSRTDIYYLIAYVFIISVKKRATNVFFKFCLNVCCNCARVRHNPHKLIRIFHIDGSNWRLKFRKKLRILID